MNTVLETPCSLSTVSADIHPNQNLLGLRQLVDCRAPLAQRAFGIHTAF